eukprot:1334229-Prymnesium_polylepis.3
MRRPPSHCPRRRHVTADNVRHPTSRRPNGASHSTRNRQPMRRLPAARAALGAESVECGPQWHHARSKRKGVAAGGAHT